MKKKSMNLLGVVLLMVAILAGCVHKTSSHGVSEEKKASSIEKKNNVYVESEFAPLKRVVLTQSEVMDDMELGDIDEDMDDDEMVGDIYESDEKEEIFSMSPEEYKKAWETERDNLKKVLEKYGVEVLRPRLLTSTEKELGKVRNGFTDGTGVTNCFARDPFFTIGNHIIEGSFNIISRRLEVLPIRDILISEANKNNSYYVAVPQPDISEGLESAKGPFLEGGDILVYGKTVFVGNSERASNKAGITWLRNYLSHFDYKVVEVKLDPDIYHLDCALSLVREGLMIVCEDALPNGIPDELKSWDKIEVSYDDALRTAINGLPINEKVYVADIAFKDSIGKELEKRGITVEYIDFKISRSLDGAFRCSTQPLLRQSDSK
ncbi:dimethylarginine dimethylaminohydrolase family protein [Oceanirhabdus sp. W0125-5]|uniref:dimethylarginine dimethylaminohydrolase family protein n=1 Tax=Oceanirhabdus sp. W0125-5 TaxID=2999116 RepID=UPI0022F2C4AC|nr:arginine deiminase family protein [Oceanirhabdus sp. W0125-5]WBW96226.1 arginine deiminase family protein [Oceanirhabdus sp. W0125-5]